MPAAHTSMYRGAKVRIILKDKTVIITKYIEKLSNRRMLTTYGEIMISDIKSCSYYKPLSHERMKT